MDIAQQFAALTELLRRHRPLWHHQPFTDDTPPWPPELTAWVDALPDDAADWLADAPSFVADLASEIRTLSALPPLPQTPLPMGADAARRIPGRKVQQIDAFCSAVLPHLAGHSGELVDWCAGKGHLGRTLLRHNGGRLLALELDPTLVAAGQREADHLGLRARFVCADVCAPATAELLQPSQFVAALHACGDLHHALLTAAVARKVTGLALAPCCYNKATLAAGGALSQVGQIARLDLTASDLALVHRDATVASPGDLKQSQQDQAWRLGFDLLLRAATGRDAYHAMPPFPRAWLRLPFGEFCQRFGALDGIAVAVRPEFEALGWQKLAQVRRRERVRGLFRAALEAWLVLDRALVLVQAGWRVEVSQFCPPTVTPRNLLIIGTR